MPAPFLVFAFYYLDKSMMAKAISPMKILAISALSTLTVTATYAQGGPPGVGGPGGGGGMTNTWKLSGNTGLSGGEFLGTTDASPVRIKTNSQGRMIIDANGNVGIGTNAPTSTLTVDGVVQSTSGGFMFPDGTVQTTAFDPTGTTNLTDVDITGRLKVGDNSIIIDGSNIPSSGVSQNHMYSSLGSGNLYVNSTNLLWVTPAGDLTANTIFNAGDNTGGVGIGTEIMPSDVKLHVRDGFVLIDGEHSSLLFDKQSTSSYGQWGIEYEANGTMDGLNFWKPFGSTNGSGAQGFGNHFLFLADNGQIGMGVKPEDLTDFDATGYRLHVRNGIITEKVKVALLNSSDWMDTVFHEDYCLRSLKEVESYVKENKHLPDVPSADELVNTGIDVMKMDATLLQKIEELTLYTIEQQRLIDEMQHQINLLRKQQMVKEKPQ